jgi:geranylgeranyl diphosphate synthase type I
MTVLDTNRHRHGLTTVSDDQTVAAVDRLIADTLSRLRTDWAALSAAVVPRPDVLHTDSVLELLSGLLATGGKRFRPRMVHWGWLAATGGDDSASYHHVPRIGAALELLHAFALIHDDVMDGSETRRGFPSVHVQARRQHVRWGSFGDSQRYGENIAILAGDLAHSEASMLAAELPAHLRTLWRTLSVELMIGQGRDLVGAANGRRDLEHAREVARAKSGAYTVWRPLQLGAAAAGASPELSAALERYGIAVGEAFALRDDILGVIGDERATGKPVGDDLIAGKPTVLLALATQRFSAKWQRLLARTGSGQLTADEVEALRQELINAGVINEVESMISAAVHEASVALASPAVHPAAAEGLVRLAHRVAWRSA